MNEEETTFSSQIEDPRIRPCVKFTSDTSSVPVYDFNGEVLAFPVNLPSRRSIQVRMAPCMNPREQIQIYDKAGGALRAVEGDEIDLLGSDMSVCRPFFFRYFRGVRNSLGQQIKKPATTDLQAEWIRANPSLKIPETVVMNGMFSIELDEEEDVQDDEFSFAEEGESTVEELNEAEADLDLFSETFSTVRTVFSSVDLASGLVVRVPLVWQFPAITEKENLTWQRATGQSRMNTRKRTITRKADHLSILKLFSGSIEALEGAFINGNPCKLSNRSEWVGFVNYGWIYAVMSHRFRSVTLKNE